MMVDSQDGANRIQDPHWDKEASHEWGKPYSDDLRERVVAAIEAGHTREEVAELYNMALSTVGGLIKRKRETGSISPDKFGGYKAFSLKPHTDLVKELVAEQPDSTLAELRSRLAKEKVKVSQSGIKQDHVF
jgi:transposase